MTESWERVRVIESGLHPYDRNRLANAVTHLVPLAARAGLLTRDRTWMEVGSGIGMKSLALGPFVSQYLAVELDADKSKIAAGLAASCGAHSIQHVASNAVTVAADVARYSGAERVDVLLLYAVLEHLLPEERREILALARHTLEQDGAVIVMETPNRLIPFDGHTSQLHHFNMLPDDLAIEYLSRSDRPEVRDAVLAETSPERRRELLYRNGRGLSYHEFELAWDRPTSELPIGFDGFAVELLNQEPLMRQEVELRRYVAGNGLPVAPAFSRAWIELVADRRLGDRNASPSLLIEPENGEHAVHRTRTFWGLDVFRLEANQRMTFLLTDQRAESLTLLLDAATSVGEVTVAVDGQVVASLDLEMLRRSRLPTWHGFAAVELPLYGAQLELRASPDSALSCNGVLV